MEPERKIREKSEMTCRKILFVARQPAGSCATSTGCRSECLVCAKRNSQKTSGGFGKWRKQDEE
eukprot:scaffold9695_cov74-Skeletonema_dohrnii-CCMP3373.AAC.6